MMKAIVASLALLLLTAQPAFAEEEFRPLVADFGGKASLSYPPTTALDISGSGTVEFWVAAQWQSNPGYDPAILGYAGPTGPRFAFHISADRKSLGVFAGKYYNTIPYDFSDGALHHVAIVTIGSSMDVYVDEGLVTSLGYGFADVPVTSFTVGSVGGYSPFIGEIGQVRIWNVPLKEAVLTKFRLRSVEAGVPDEHPNLDSLAAISTFGNPESGGFLFFGETAAIDMSPIADAMP